MQDYNHNSIITELDSHHIFFLNFLLLFNIRLFCLDESTYYAFKLELKKQKIKTRNCTISFSDGKLKFGSFRRS
jgi:hypothetical protein